MNENPNYCPNCHGYYIRNLVTGEIVRLGCNRYDCIHCGKIKAWKFKKALKKYLDTFKLIKFWTFNVRTTNFYNPQQWNRISSEVWRRFLNNIRRNKSLTKYQRTFQYVKVAEFTQKGYIHFHVVINCFLSHKIVYTAWNEALATVMSETLIYDECGKLGENSLGGVNIIQIPNSKTASNYLTKYLLKSSADVTQRTEQILGIARKRVRLYTKSNKVAFFPKKHGANAWLFINAGANSETESIYLNILAVTSPDLATKYIENFSQAPPET